MLSKLRRLDVSGSLSPSGFRAPTVLRSDFVEMPRQSAR
jgi:hypothetical protein